MKSETPNQLVAIVGGSGAGKSWLAERLQSLLGEKAGRLSLDNFYRDRSHLPPSRRERINFDVPSAIDWPCVERVLRECRAGHPTRLPRYDFITHCRLSDREPWQPKPLILMDGLWLLLRPKTRRLFNLKVFVDCPARLRFRRRLARDVTERGRKPASVRRQFRTTVAPMHEKHVAPQKRWADLVLNQPLNEPDILHLSDHLWTLLKTGSLLPAWMRATFRAELLTLLKRDQHHD